MAEERLYTKAELRAAIDEATEQEHRMSTCETEIGNLKEWIGKVDGNLTVGLTGLRAEIRALNGWRQSSKPLGYGAGAGALMGPIFYYLAKSIFG